MYVEAVLDDDDGQTVEKEYPGARRWMPSHASRHFPQPSMRSTVRFLHERMDARAAFSE
jgi:hypothetical protein